MKKLIALIAFILSITIAATACSNVTNSSAVSVVTTSQSVTQEITAPTTTESSAVPETTTTKPDPNIINEVPGANAIPNICTSRYGYYMLSADEKAVYDQISNAARGFQQTVILKKKLPTDTIDNIFKLMCVEENDLYYVNSYTSKYNQTTNLVISIDLGYKFTKTEVEQLNQAVNEKVNAILSQIPADATPISKIKIFHDTIILSCNYNLTYNYGATPYGSLVAGEATCEGYARAFALLCNKVGIENLFSTGKYDNEGHIWNMVKLDGNWYNMDLTWDDPPYASPNETDQNPEYYIEYNYFLYKNDQSGVNLTVDNKFFTVPETNSSKYNYFIYYGYYVKSYDDAVTNLSKQISSALKTGKKYIRIRFDSSEIYTAAYNKLFGDELEIFNENITPKGKISSYTSYHFDTLHIIQMEINLEE